MGEIKASIYNGEYEVIFNEGTGELKAKRHGVEWRDLTGDNLVLSMLTTIVDQEEKLFQQQFNTPVGNEHDWSGATHFIDRGKVTDIMKEAYDNKIKEINKKIDDVTSSRNSPYTGREERVELLRELLKLEEEKLETMKGYEQDVLRSKEYLGVEQANDPFFRMVNFEDATLDGIINTMSKMTTLSTGLADDDWVIDTDGLIMGDPVLKMAKISNTHDKEFYASATDIALYLAHEVKRLREGYKFLGNSERSQRNMEWDNQTDLQNFAISVIAMAKNNLLGTSHDGTKRKFFKYGKELS